MSLSILPCTRLPLLLVAIIAGGPISGYSPAFPPAQAEALAPAPTASTDLPAQPQVQQGLERLMQRGFVPERQGIWLQSNHAVLLGVHQGTTPLPAASITKVATTLVALHTLGWDHRFPTWLSSSGTIQNGVLTGDLIVTGAGDPFFVWEDAVAVGNALNQVGIQQVQGDLVIAGPFFMNFRSDPQVSGELLKAGLNGSTWPPEAETQFRLLPPNTRRPQVQIQGEVRRLQGSPTATPLIRHRSLPLVELLKRMNQYSNNVMADMLAETLGGAQTLAETAAELSGVSPAEIQLINGSGLGVENQISPRAACGLFLATQQELVAQGLSLGDAFQIVDREVGVLEQRAFPTGVVAKSGTLNQVSGLAGILPTRDQGEICFAILNVSFDLEGARSMQAELLHTLVNRWGEVTDLPTALTPTLPRPLTPETEILLSR